MNWRLTDFDFEKKIFFIKVKVLDLEPQDFGPFSIYELKKMFNEKRIDGRNWVFCTDMDNWRVLADCADFYEIFGEQPPEISALERRVLTRVEFDHPCIIEDQGREILAKSFDLSMLATKIEFKTKQIELDADQEFTIRFDYPTLLEHHFHVKVLRLFDKIGDTQTVTLKFINLSKEQREALSQVIHANI